ncbi:MAG: hypothetical protein COT90_04690 [Candidatus Diapherotrites archaeon CG10_big_fil_rev_8_21_14_0_10_31_34]|nr:MAG: hypothetical protein COT90_04690 [Candidatus Diapherotrites archaeon CG10_big_fil_rev_8_21_14_0_10_31_34]PJA19269.1 MAG: hypothetical protein COX63_01660 [Candidatus Diapherotrites archaeon CG_4_10_14_0_2_um_filter_31_5]
MNLNFVKTWFNVLIKPKETLDTKETVFSLKKATFSYLISFFILGGIGFLFFIYPSAHLELKSLLTRVLFLGLLMIGFGVLLTLVYYPILFVISKMFGGKGTITKQYCLVSLIFLPVFILLSIVNFVTLLLMKFFLLPLELLPFLNLIILVYWLYLMVLVLEKIHEYNKVRALLSLVFWIVTVLIPWLLITITSMVD